MEMRRSKRALVLAAVAVLLLLPVTTFAAGQREAAAEAGPMEISWQGFGPDKQPRTWASSVADEKFSVRIVGNGVWQNDTEKVNLMLASGETPEVFTAGDAAQQFADGLIREIPLEMMRKYAPGHVKWMDANPLAWRVGKSPKNPDNFLCLVGFAATGDWPLMGLWSTRADWAEKVGMALPDYKTKRWKVSTDSDRTWFYPGDFTLAQVDDLLRRYLNNDPDGNGKNDTIPVSACNDTGWSWATLYGAFGLPMYGFTVSAQGTSNHKGDNGETVPAAISPRFKKFLLFLHDWYAKGYIDKEFPTLTLQKMWEKDMAELTGVQFTSNTTYVSNTIARPPNHVSLDKVAKGASIVMLPPPVGPEGFRGTQRYTAQGNINTGWGLRVRADVSDAKLAKILQIWDWRQYDKDGWWICQFGKPGVHFDWPAGGKPYDSKPVVRTFADVKKQFPNELPQGKFFQYPYNYFPDKAAYIYADSAVNIFKNLFMTGAMDSYLTRPFRWDLFGETKLKAISDRYAEGMNTLATEFYYRAITGQIDINAEWDGYVKNWLDKGGKDYIAEFSKAVQTEPLNTKGQIVY